MKFLLFSSLFSFLLLAESAQKIRPVSFVDLKRYTGTWYEIARLPNATETNCMRITTEYTLKQNGLLSILSRCTKENGYARESQGKVRINNSPSNSMMSTNFVPHWLSWTGIGWEDYWIIDIDKNYQFAVISDPNKDYLWILSRKESIDKTIYEKIIDKLKNQHFDLSHLIVSGEIISQDSARARLDLPRVEPSSG